MADDGAVREAVKAKYGQAARRVAEGAAGSCCGDRGRGENPITGGLYAPAETAGVPGEAVAASLGCGNPVALAELSPGQVVLDLGSGGGLDAILAARRVGPTGRVYGVDMTEEMLALARENQRKAGVSNATFLRGEIEALPLPDASVDVIVSNCVINLSANKPRVFAEAFRVLRPGGRLAVHDIVTRRPVPALVRRSLEAWTGCLAGALQETEYVRLLGAAGFERIEVQPTRVYRAHDARVFLEAQADLRAALAREGRTLDTLLAEVDGAYASAFVRARRPPAAPATGPLVDAAIGPARPEDLDAVLALLASAGLPAAGVAEHFPHFLVARVGPAVVGAIGLEPYGPAALLRSAVVAPGSRGLGLGRALTERLLGTAQAAGVRRVFLLTETAADFFAGLGFRRIARSEADPAVQGSVEFATACCQTATCMRRDLD